MIHTFVRAEAKLSLNEEAILKIIYDHWPRCVEKMTDKTAGDIVTSYGWPQEIELTINIVKSVYRKRKKSTVYKSKDFTRKGFTEDEKLLLELMYKHWPRRISKLNEKCKEILRPLLRNELEDRGKDISILNQLEFVFQHRKFKSITVKLPNKPAMTPEEERVIETIYFNWPRDSPKMTKKVAQHMHKVLLETEHLDISIERIKSIFKDAKWSKRGKMQGPRSPRVHWAAANNELELLKHYISLGDDINEKDEDGKTPLEITCNLGRFPVVGMLIKNPLLKINTRDAQSKTILMKQCENQHYDMVEMLLSREQYFPHDIQVGEAISIINNHRLKSMMIRMNIQNSSQTQMENLKKSSEGAQNECGHYDIDQGQTGICYLVAVLILFRNHPDFIARIKQSTDKNLLSTIQFLSADYSSMDFTKQCPKMPSIMIQAVTNNRVTRRGAMTKNGGNAFTLTMFILNMLDAYTDMTVDMWHIRRRLSAENWRAEIKGTYNKIHNDIGYIDADMDIEFDTVFFELFQELCQECPHIKGFIFRLTRPGFDHIVSATVCHGKLFVCNSWGSGCTDNFNKVVREIGQPTTISNIGIFAYNI